MEAIVFAKPPRPGEAKSRLAEAIGDHAAASFAEAALIDTINRLRAVDGLRVSLSTSRLVNDWPAEVRDIAHRLQPPGDLGHKMAEAIEYGLTRDSKVMLWGADAPHFAPECPTGVERALEEVDVVLCPAQDGGFYALGTRVSLTGLFGEIPWGSATVCDQTCRALECAGLSVRLLYPNFDIDYSDDLKRLFELLALSPGLAPEVERWFHRWVNEHQLGLGWPK